jgi:hypothetical protein
LVIIESTTKVPLPLGGETQSEFTSSISENKCIITAIHILRSLTADPRRYAQTVIFPPDDLSGEKPACPSGNQVFTKQICSGNRLY